MSIFKLAGIIQEAPSVISNPDLSLCCCWNLRPNEAILWFCRGSWEGLTSKGYAPGKQLACLTAPGPDCLVNPQQKAQKTSTCPSGLRLALLDRHEPAICAWGPLSTWIPRPPLALNGTGWPPHSGFWCLVTGSDSRAGESEETLSIWNYQIMLSPSNVSPDQHPLGWPFASLKHREGIHQE